MVILYYFFLGTLGVIFGSFASAVLPRIHEKRDFVRARSACSHCSHTLSFFDLIPILSYLSLFGKCRYCKKSIPVYHTLLESAMMIGFLLVGYWFNSIYGIFHITTHAGLFTLGFLLVSMFVSITLSAYDLLYMEIPDEILIPFLTLAFLFIGAASLGCIDPLIFEYFKPFSSWELLQNPLLNVLAGSLPIFSFFLVLILVSKGRWMGGGDLRVALLMGFVAGAKIAWLGLFLSYMVGSIIGIGVLLVKRERNIMIPFGPFLVIGLWLSFFFYDPLLGWYLSLLIQ